MAGEDKPGIGGAVTLIAVVVALVTLGFNVLVFVLNEQGSLQEQQAKLAETKADKEDVNRKAADRYTGTMARLQKECEAEKHALRDEIRGKEVESVRWEARWNDCEEGWELHRMVCGCNRTSNGE